MFGTLSPMIIGSIDLLRWGGVFFIVYGYSFMILEKLWGTSYSISRGKYSSNPCLTVIIGGAIVSYTIAEGILVASILILAIATQKIIISNHIEKKRSELSNREGLAIKDINKKGKASFYGNKYKVYSKEEYIPKGTNIVVCNFIGSKIYVKSRD